MDRPAAVVREEVLVAPYGLTRNMSMEGDVFVPMAVQVATMAGSTRAAAVDTMGEEGVLAESGPGAVR